MACRHQWVAVGKKRYCVKCGVDFYNQPKPKKKEKKVNTEKSDDISSTDVK